MALSPDQQSAVFAGINDIREDLSVPFRERGKSGGRVLRDLIPLSEPIQSKVVPENRFSAAELLQWIDLNASQTNTAMGQLIEQVKKLADEVAKLKEPK
ncbi:hypothetical protein [Amycolatopsis sp. CA-230715]|uniref:hypothetical protein n=1 Tax=Amycolatopsis sp. CA-230715 TaxID=2745196 RepID=UPI001C035984|nr:hypothetical protein [Amycolatopsis sp. CA-230715]QWF79014.1 hypothetical protein HUW46_02415 [Amycolatopsis sp. CA-230715]